MSSKLKFSHSLDNDDISNGNKDLFRSKYQNFSNNNNNNSNLKKLKTDTRKLSLNNPVLYKKSDNKINFKIQPENVYKESIETSQTQKRNFFNISKIQVFNHKDSKASNEKLSLFSPPPKKLNEKRFSLHPNVKLNSITVNPVDKNHSINHKPSETLSPKLSTQSFFHHNPSIDSDKTQKPLHTRASLEACQSDTSMFNGLVIPVAAWGRKALNHAVTSIFMTSDMKYMVTGCEDGHMCVWTHDSFTELNPKLMLFGHSSAITCLALSTSNHQDTWIVSSSDNGEMCLWDLADGRCIESIKSSVIHTNIQTHQMLQTKENKLICNGYYPEIYILHAIRLNVVFTLTSLVQPDWVIAVCVSRPVKQEDDVIMAVTNGGLIKMWNIPVTELRQGIGLFERESKQTRCVNARMIRCCIYNQQTVLIVCTKYWQIFDSTDFSLLCSESSSFGERWVGGDFLAVDKVVVWSDKGRGYLYVLPSNTNPGDATYRHQLDPSRKNTSSPTLFKILDGPQDEVPITSSPIMMYVMKKRENDVKLLLRGDSNGKLSMWSLNEAHFDTCNASEVCSPDLSTSLADKWKLMQNEGLVDHLSESGRKVYVTCTVFIALNNRIACGRSDGLIIVTSATKAIHRLFFTDNPHESITHQTLIGHQGKVNCLLYPSNESAHHESHILVSGGQDFCLIVWDLRTSSKLYSFCVQGGEILQLIVPPAHCSNRVQSSVCSIASDHSLALLSIKDRKCILLATRHIFPILLVRFRPLDDFVIVACTDGTVYVWQMETGHLDRVVHGAAAEDILMACDEKNEEEVDGKVNTQISIGQALKRHNVASFKHLAQQHFKKAQEAISDSKMSLNKLPHPSLVQKSDTFLPLMIQPLTSLCKNTDSHVIYFNTETIIVQLLSEEYSALSPDSLEKIGFYTKVAPNQGYSETQKMVYDIMYKVKNKADSVSKKIQTKVDTAKNMGSIGQTTGATPPGSLLTEKANETQAESMESAQLKNTLMICQLFMSCLHAWGLDKAVDDNVLSKLGFIKPRKTISFGYLSPGGQLALMIPELQNKPKLPSLKRPLKEPIQNKNPFLVDDSDDDQPPIKQAVNSRLQHRHQPISPLALETASQPPLLADFNLHYEISNAYTTQHLLSVISLTNTLMSMSKVTFKHLEPPDQTSNQGSESLEFMNEVSDFKKDWSLVASLHCILLPDLVNFVYKPPLLEMLARRWQDRCLEIRESSQALLLAELRRLGIEGGKKVIDDWAPYLPYDLDPVMTYVPSDVHNTPPPSQQNLSVTYIQAAGGVGGIVMPMSSAGEKGGSGDDEEDDEDGGILGGSEHMGLSQLGTSKYKYARQATAIVMLGVIGFEFGASVTASSENTNNVPEGFSFTNSTHARNTSKALANLLLQPAQHNVGVYSLMRRAAVDLIGRGFVVWEPYLDVSSILIGLLELCIDGNQLVPNVTFGLPLTPKADACRTARHSLSLVATAKPATFIITMAREVARFNSMLQNAQAQQYQYSLHASVLSKAKSEILRILQVLVEKAAPDIVDHLFELTDIAVHCLDISLVKNKGLHEVFPAYCKKFPMVNYCHTNKRIIVGNISGMLCIYDLRHGKCQSIKGHNGRVHSVSYSPDGKTFASFSLADKKIHFWQISSGSLFNIGAQHLKCVKTFTVNAPDTPTTISPLKYSQLVWINPRTISIILWDKSESRYRF